MFTLKRISGVSPSGAEINVKSYVQIFLSPRCWRALTQSTGLEQILWAAQLNTGSHQFRLHGLYGIVQCMCKYKEQTLPLPSVHMCISLVIPTASMCAYKNCYIGVYNCEVLSSQSQSQRLLLFSLIKPL